MHQHSSHHTPLHSGHPGRLWGAVCRRLVAGVGALLAAAFLIALPSVAEADDNSLSCTVKEGKVTCDVNVKGFLSGSIRDVLNNGWENTLHFNIYILDADENTVGLAYAEVTQRCYIDPFDDPCLALWADSESWDTYTNVDDLIAGIGVFRLNSMDASELPAGTYSARVAVELNPITTSQAKVIRKWLARNRGGHLVVGKNDASVFGTFVSVFANVRAGHAEATFFKDGSSFVVSGE